ncbi:MAG: hypothetical protein PHW04_01515 [Candidatus Wallbacteria bacterium]|nr:hypothetical protein [Candidatus Wallbacteria bacterium]
MDLLEQLKSTDPDKLRAAIIEIAKLESLDPDRLKILYAELQKIIGKNDKALNFFVRKATRNLEKIEKLGLDGEAKHSTSLQKAAEGLEEGLDSPDRTVRLNTLHALTNSGLPKAELTRVLEKFAESAAEDEAIAAIELLDKNGPKRTVKAAQPEVTSPLENPVQPEAAVEDDNPQAQVAPPVRKSWKFPLKTMLFLILLLGISGTGYWKLCSPEERRNLFSREDRDELKEILPGPDLLKDRASEFLKALDGKDYAGFSRIAPAGYAGNFSRELQEFMLAKFPRGWTVSLLLSVYDFEKSGLILFLLRESERVTLLSQKWQVEGKNWIPSGIPQLVSVLPNLENPVGSGSGKDLTGTSESAGSSLEVIELGTAETKENGK